MGTHTRALPGLRPTQREGQQVPHTSAVEPLSQSPGELSSFQNQSLLRHTSWFKESVSVGFFCLFESLEVKVRSNVLFLFTELCSFREALSLVLEARVPLVVLRDLDHRG